MTLKVLGALLIAATVSGCSDHHHRDECTIYIDPAGMTEQELDVVVESVEEWNDAMAGVVTMSPVVGTPPSNVSFPHTVRAFTAEESERHPEYSGFTGHGQWENSIQHITVTLNLRGIRVGAAEPMMQLKHTTLHELGHHLGLGHNEDEGAVMVARAPDVENETACITVMDVTRACQQFTNECEGHNVHSTCKE